MASASVRGDPTCRKEYCLRFDVGLIYGTIARFSDAEKFKFIQNVWKPDVQFNFPQYDRREFGKLRKFRQDWLIRFPWLMYSTYLDGPFCLPCLSFEVKYGTNVAALDRLFCKPFSFGPRLAWHFSGTRVESARPTKYVTQIQQMLKIQHFPDTAPLDAPQKFID